VRHRKEVNVMLVMLCRNRVQDFSTWKRVFDSKTDTQVDAGLRLIHLWREVEDPDNVFFLFEVTDRQKAEALISSPDSAEIGRQSGVLDGECHFLEEE
jgi:hypothetical protein